MKGKIKEHKDWYIYLNKKYKIIERIEKERQLTIDEEIQKDEIIDMIDYIYKLNGYT